jgi:hypothetical protein
MKMSERHRWCGAKIEEAFKPELESETVQQFIRNEKNLAKFSAFFRGESSGRLFIFYQPEGNGNGEVSIIKLASGINVYLWPTKHLSCFHCAD